MGGKIILCEEALSPSLSRMCSHDVKYSSSPMGNMVAETTSKVILVTKRSAAGDTHTFIHVSRWTETVQCDYKS